MDAGADRGTEEGGTVGKRYLRFPITILFPMLDGETIEQAEDRMIERIDQDGDVEVMSWNEGEVEVFDDDDEVD